MRVTQYTIQPDHSRLPVAELRHRLAVIEAQIHSERVRCSFLAYLENQREELDARIKAFEGA